MSELITDPKLRKKISLLTLGTKNAYISALPANVQARAEEHFKGEHARQLIANRLFVRGITGKTKMDPGTYAHWRGIIGEQLFDLPRNAPDTVFHGKLKERMQFEKDRDKLREDLAAQALYLGISGKELTWKAAYDRNADWLPEDPGYSEKDALDHLQRYRGAFDKAKEMVSPGAFKTIAENLELAYELRDEDVVGVKPGPGTLGDAPDFNDVARQIMKATEGDPLKIEVMMLGLHRHLQENIREATKGAVPQMRKEFLRTMERQVTGGRRFMKKQWLRAAPAVKKASPLGAAVIPEPKPEDRAQLDIESKLEEVMFGVYDPNKGYNLVEKILLGQAQVAGFSAVAASTWMGTVISFTGLADQEATRFQMENPGVSDETADLVGMVRAAPQAFFNRLQGRLAVKGFLGKHPSVAAIMGRLAGASPGMRRLVGAGTVTGQEFAMEKIEDLASEFGQELLEAFRKDMPNLDWSEDVWGKYFDAEENFVLFMSILPLGLIGGGALGYRDFKEGGHLLEDSRALRMVLSEEDAAKMEAASTLEEKQAVLREISARNGWEITEEKIRDAVSAADREQEAMPSQLMPKKVGDKWLVADDEGGAPSEFEGLDDAVAFARERASELGDLELFEQAEAFSGRKDISFEKTVFNPRSVKDIYEDAKAVGLENKDTLLPLGETEWEFKDGVFSAVIRLGEGANFTTVVREVGVADGFKFQQKGFIGPEAMTEMLREWEEKSGDSVLKVQSQMGLAEAWGDMVLAYAAASKFQGGGFSKRLKGILDGYKIKFRAILNEGRKLLGQVIEEPVLGRAVSRSEVMKRMMKEGRLDPKLESFLAESIGLETQARVEKQFAKIAKKEAPKMAEDLGLISEEELEGFEQMPMRQGMGRAFTLTTVKGVESLTDIAESRAKDPEEKIKVFGKLKGRLSKLKETIEKGGRIRGLAPESPRYDHIMALAQYDAIVASMPEKVRAKVSGYSATLGAKATPASAHAFLKKNLDKATKALDAYLKKNNRAKIKNWINKAKVKKQGKSPRGKIGATNHKIAEAAAKAMDMSAEDAKFEARKALNRFKGIDNPTALEQEEIWGMVNAYELFAEFNKTKDKDIPLSRMERMVEFLSRNYGTGRERWLKELQRREDKKREDLASLMETLESPDISDSSFNTASRTPGRIRKVLSEFNSIYDLIYGLADSGDKQAVAFAEYLEGQYRRAWNRYDESFSDIQKEFQGKLFEIFKVPKMPNTPRSALLAHILVDLRAQKDWGEALFGEHSQLDLLKEWLALRQEDMVSKYEKSGRDAKYREALENALIPEMKELGLWMVEAFEKRKASMDRKHRSEYGVGIAFVDEYFPALFEAPGQDRVLTMDGEEVQVGVRTGTWNIPRVPHGHAPRKANAAALFMSTMADMTFWESHVTVSREISGMLRTKDARRALTVRFGPEFAKTFYDFLDVVDMGGRAKATVHLALDEVFRSMRGATSVARLALNIKTILVNFGNWMVPFYELGFAKMLKGFSPSGAGSFMDDANVVWGSPTLSGRREHGGQVETRYVISGKTSGGGWSTFLRGLARDLISPLNFADVSSNMSGVLFYRHHLSEARKTMKEEDARAYALDKFDSLVTRRSQPVSPGSRSLIENVHKDTLGGAFLMFIAERRKQSVLLYHAWRKIFTGRGAMSKGEAGRRLVVGMAFYAVWSRIIYGLIEAIVDGEGDSDEPLERIADRVLDPRAMTAEFLSVPVTGIPIFGDSAEMGIAQALNQTTFDKSENVLLNANRAGSELVDMFESQTDEELFNSTVDFSQAIGSIAPQFSVAAGTANLIEDLESVISNTLAPDEESKMGMLARPIRRALRKIEAEESTKDKSDNEKQAIYKRRYVKLLEVVRENGMRMPPEKRKAFYEYLKEKKIIPQRGVYRPLINSDPELK